MGIVALSGVGPWRLAEEPDPDQARPVGRRETFPRQHTATLVDVDEDKGLVIYGPEIPIAVYASEVRELPQAVADRLRFSRLHAWLFIVNNRECVKHGIAAKDLSVSFSALPYSQNRFFTSRLRRASHRSSSETTKQLVAALVAAAEQSSDAEHQLQMALDTLSVTPLFHGSGSFAAWMVHPSQAEGLGAARFNPQQDYTVGVCQDIERCRQLLRIDKIVEQLLNETQDGTLFAGMRRHPDPGTGPVARPLSARARAGAGMAMDLSIQLACAGLVNVELLGRNRPLVARQVAIIYRGLIYRWSQSDEETEMGPILLDDPRSEPSTAAETPERERIEAIRMKLDVQGEERVIELFTARLRDAPDPDEDFVRLIVACPPHWVLSRELVEYLRQSLAALDPDWALSAIAKERISSETNRR